MNANEIDRLKGALRDAAAQIASLESDLGGANARIAELEAKLASRLTFVPQQRGES